MGHWTVFDFNFVSLLNLQIAFNRTNLYALATLSNRPLFEAGVMVNDSNIISYIKNILTIPGYIYYVLSLCPEVR